MALDATTLAALLGFLGLVVTSVTGFFVATRANKAEKVSSTMKALEETRDEVYEGRLILRDEKIDQLRLDLNECKSDKEMLCNQIDQLKEKR